MKKGLFLTLLACSVWLPIHARIGETLEQCVERYGPVMERRPSTLPGSEAELAVFSKSSITILAEFREGVVWQISFRKPGLSLAEADAILQANASGLWSVPLKINEQDYRLSLDKKRLLTMRTDKKGGTSEMVIMTRDCAAAVRSARESKTDKPRSSQEQKPASNPLPGF
ncbi:hypothetical protein BH11VER1_BH11VER1_08840 [soil metagenome]